MASTYIEKAIALDTLEANKMDYIISVANTYLTAKNYAEAGRWYARLTSIKKNPTKTDLYNAGINYYRAATPANLKSADSLFTIYQQKYPDDVLGWYYGAIVKANMDSSSALGLAVPDYQKLIEVATTLSDSVRSKQLQITGYKYFVNYNYNVKKDKAATIAVIDKILALDPNDETAKANKAALMGTKVKVDDDKTKVKTDSSKTKSTPTKTKVKDK